MKPWLRIAAWLILVAGSYLIGRAAGKAESDTFWQKYCFESAKY